MMSNMDKARKIITEVDREMVKLFEQRMDAVRQIAAYKQEHNLPVEDIEREVDVIRTNSALITNSDYAPFYSHFIRSVIETSKDYQRCLVSGPIFVKSHQGGYYVHCKRGLIHCAGELFDLNRKVLIVTDSGVPEQYVMTVASQCAEAIVFVFEKGDNSKSIETYSAILNMMADNEFKRTDCVVAVGGGVVGDLAGFAAATYMRGVDFYNVPTTLLAQVDSSVGGKTGINFASFKNQIGAFYPPKGVLIDTKLLETLPPRQMANGVAEIIKMALTLDPNLFEEMERNAVDEEMLDDIVRRCVLLKAGVVQSDEYEHGLRKVLNFGHTIGHGIEAVTHLLHGECVAIGMVAMCSARARERLVPMLLHYGLPVSVSCHTDDVINACNHDKKSNSEQLQIVQVSDVGCYEFVSVDMDDIKQRLKEVLGK